MSYTMWSGFLLRAVTCNRRLLALLLCGYLCHGHLVVQDEPWLDGEASSSAGTDASTSVAILVHCRREGFEARDTIRRTWASQLPLGTSVAFVVGAQGCAIPPLLRMTEYGCDFNEQLNLDVYSHTGTGGAEQSWLEAVRARHAAREEALSARLRTEQEEHGDLAVVDMHEVGGDHYLALPHKLKRGLAWVLARWPHVNWVVKLDDDTFLRPRLLVDYLKDLGAPGFTVLGSLVRDHPISPHGKYREVRYMPRTGSNGYPLFPLGSRGAVMSTAVARFVVGHDGVEYSGEDTSLGIWLDEADASTRDNLRWINGSELGFHEGAGDCSQANAVFVGHDTGLTPVDLRRCSGHHVAPLFEMGVEVTGPGARSAPAVFRHEYGDHLADAVTSFCIRYAISVLDCHLLRAQTEEQSASCGYEKECPRGYTSLVELEDTSAGHVGLYYARHAAKVACGPGGAPEAGRCFVDSVYPASEKAVVNARGSVVPMTGVVPLPDGHSYLLPDGEMPVNDAVVDILDTLLREGHGVDGEGRIIVGSVVEIDAGVGQVGRSLLSRGRGYQYRALDRRGNVHEFSAGLVEWFDPTQGLAVPERADWALALGVLDQCTEEEAAVLSVLHDANCRGVLVSWALPGAPQAARPNNHGEDYVLETFYALGYRQRHVNPAMMDRLDPAAAPLYIFERTYRSAQCQHHK